MFRLGLGFQQPQSGMGPTGGMLQGGLGGNSLGRLPNSGRPSLGLGGTGMRPGGLPMMGNELGMSRARPGDWRDRGTQPRTQTPWAGHQFFMDRIGPSYDQMRTPVEAMSRGIAPPQWLRRMPEFANVIMKHWGEWE